jgi:hypothetical protein
MKDIISKAHHAYPCNASMKNDPKIGDTTLHIAGYIHREAVYSAILKHIPNPDSKAKQIIRIKNEIEELKNYKLKKIQ